MQAVMRRWGFQNTDLRYYRDKYVAGLFVFSMIVAIVIFSDWPPNHAELIKGVRLLILAAACVALSRFPVVAVAALFAFAAFRIFLGAIFAAWWPGLIIALGVGSMAMVLVLGRLWFKGDYSLPYEIGPYSTGEAIIDVLAFLLMLGLIRQLIA